MLQKTFAARVAILSLLCIGATQAQEAAKQTQATAKPAQDLANQTLETRLDDYMNALTALHRFGGAVLVARDGVPVLAKGYGFANAEWQVANAPTVKFRVGSITKQFTATLIMMLQNDGKLAVSDPVCKFVPACPAAWRPITLHQILTHTAGVPEYTELPSFKRTQALPATPAQLLARFKSLPLDFKPGTKFKYSNSGYVLLGFVLERVTGTPYATLLKTRIFDVVHMDDSGYDDNAAIIPHRAAGYTSRRGQLANAAYIDMTIPYAAGSIYSTVKDLLKWDQALYTTALLPKGSLDAMFTPYKAIAGYGWAIDTQFGHKMISHNGGIDGFVSNIARYPDDKVTIIVLSNLEMAPIGPLAKDLAAIVFDQPYTIPAEANYISLAQPTLALLAGRYRVDVAPDIVVEIIPAQDGVVCHVQGQTFRLRPETTTKFSSEDAMASLVFDGDGSKPPPGLVFNGQFKATRIP
jgi:CubicO group peptidase (beta-lactamase class C family)